MLKLVRNGGQSFISAYYFRRVFGYTTSATTTTNDLSSNNFTVDYLVNSLGFSKQQASIASSKVSPFKSTQNPDSVIDFLKTSGFNNTQIKQMVYSCPKILSSNVVKTLKPKLEAFMDIGLSGSDLTGVISARPDILARSLNGHIVPSLMALKSVFGDGNDDILNVLKATKAYSWFLAAGIHKRLPENVALLQSYGFSADKIKVLFLRKSRYFALDPKWLQAVLVRVEEKIGIPRDSAMFFHGVIALASVSEEALELKFEIYRSFGWTDSDISILARRNPYTLMISQPKLEKTLSLFMKDLGHQPAEIAARASILTLSVEKRVIPRIMVIKALKEKGLINHNYCHLSSLSISDAKFAERFLLPFKDKIPRISKDYMRRVCPPLEAGGK